MTALVLIIASMFRRKKLPEPAPVLVKRYVHPGHTWARVTGDGDVVVGMDEFAQSVIGTVQAVGLPRLLHRVTQGGTALWVQHNHRRVPLVSPVSGWVIEKNDMVVHTPSLINTSPYGDGWLFKVRPRNVESQMHNLFTGKAMQQWQEAARAQLNRLFTGIPALMYQDGGVLVHNLSDRCSDKEWAAIVSDVFLVQDDATRTMN
jgi:glycine cleavage system H lipoate-binding protein